jgi:DNA-binding CsgD family transcriptional regulator
MAQTQAKQSEPQGKATIDRSRWQEGMITKTPPPRPNKEYVEKTRQIYLRAVERRLKRETILTGRQRDILVCIIGRFSNKQIAEKLNMSRQRVDQHIAALLKKTGEKDKVGLVLWLIGFGSYESQRFGAHLDDHLKRAGKMCDCPRCASEAARSAQVTANREKMSRGLRQQAGGKPK